MAQIKGRDYAGKYALSGKRITPVGISFSAEKRTMAFYISRRDES